MTEEVWSWRFADDGRPSVHTADWPVIAEVEAVPHPDHEETYQAAVEVLTVIRGTKTKAQKSLRWLVSNLEIRGSERHREALSPVLEDVLRAGNVAADGVTVSDGMGLEGQRFEVIVELADEMPE